MYSHHPSTPAPALPTFVRKEAIQKIPKRRGEVGRKNPINNPLPLRLFWRLRTQFHHSIYLCIHVPRRTPGNSSPFCTLSNCTGELQSLYSTWSPSPAPETTTEFEPRRGPMQRQSRAKQRKRRYLYLPQQPHLTHTRWHVMELRSHRVGLFRSARQVY